MLTVGFPVGGAASLPAKLASFPGPTMGDVWWCAGGSTPRSWHVGRPITPVLWHHARRAGLRTDQGHLPRYPDRAGWPGRGAQIRGEGAPTTVGFLHGQSALSPHQGSRWTTWGTVSSGFREIEIGWGRLGTVGLFVPFLALGPSGDRSLGNDLIIRKGMPQCASARRLGRCERCDAAEPEP
jgi:hypothetical protein